MGKYMTRPLLSLERLSFDEKEGHVLSPDLCFRPVEKWGPRAETVPVGGRSRKANSFPVAFGREKRRAYAAGLCVDSNPSLC